jgi:hypothetical protein
MVRYVSRKGSHAVGLLRASLFAVHCAHDYLHRLLAPICAFIPPSLCSSIPASASNTPSVSAGIGEKKGILGDRGWACTRRPVKDADLRHAPATAQFSPVQSLRRLIGWYCSGVRCAASVPRTTSSSPKALSTNWRPPQSWTRSPIAGRCSTSRRAGRDLNLIHIQHGSAILNKRAGCRRCDPRR